jgi:hypothetical protein
MSPAKRILLADARKRKWLTRQEEDHVRGCRRHQQA